MDGTIATPINTYSIGDSDIRPWGAWALLDAAPGFAVKRITVMPGQKLSLQKHRQRAEHWTVVSGTALVTRDDEVHTLGERQSIDLPLGSVHRLENPGQAPLVIIEIQLGSYL